MEVHLSALTVLASVRSLYKHKITTIRMRHDRRGRSKTPQTNNSCQRFKRVLGQENNVALILYNKLSS